jgi:hypothetical protein
MGISLITGAALDQKFLGNFTHDQLRKLTPSLEGDFMRLKQETISRLKDNPGFIWHKGYFKWTNRTMEDALCEFRKYHRALGGKRSRCYKPRADARV